MCFQQPQLPSQVGKLNVPMTQASQLSPTTLEWQKQCPVATSQLLSTAPSALHEHSIKRNIYNQSHFL